MDFTELLTIITDHVLSVAGQEQQEPVLFLTGEVISVNPLQIKINEKFILEENSLLLSATVKETWIDIPTTPESESEGKDGVFMHRHEIDAETELANDGQGSDHKHAIKIYTEYALPKIRLWRGLVVGDVVRLLKIQDGQFYFVLEREEMITNEGPVESEEENGNS